MIGYIINTNGNVVKKCFNDKDMLEELQNEVGGYIETLTFLREKIVVIVNEEGKLLGLPPNCYIKSKHYTELLVGNVIILGILNDDFCSISEREAIQPQMPLQNQLSHFSY